MDWGDKIAIMVDVYYYDCECLEEAGNDGKDC